MYKLLSFTALTLAVIIPAHGLVVPRTSPPPGWATDYLEPYEIYHIRYIALGCHEKHDTPFFDECCHPLLAMESLAAHPSQCIPSVASSSSAPAVSPTPMVNPLEDDSDCEQLDNSTLMLAHSSTSTEGTQHGREKTSVSTAHIISTHVPSQSLAVPASIASEPAPTHTSKSYEAASMKKNPHVPRPTTHVNSAHVNSGGFATYFYQGGNAGACGTVHSDNDLIAAIDADRYGYLGSRSNLCGKKVKITNPSNNKSVTVTIADACPTCRNSNSIDLSLEAFKQIADLSRGIVAIDWVFL
ncbi:hypothetical protein AX17_003383 [Amanita inopinata Kibby_2008]|nr:hypothetical protein AX17_003383 [Amanita inopinata Kibby_2008]